MSTAPPPTSEPTASQSRMVPEPNGVAPDDHGPDVHALNALVVGADGIFGDEGDFGVVVEFHVEGLKRVEELKDCREPLWLTRLEY